MELSIFARFHARKGMEAEVDEALRQQVPCVWDEAGCLEIGAYRSTRDPRLFWIASHWADEAAFEVHAELPNTVRFIERMQALIDHPFEVSRASRIA